MKGKPPRKPSDNDGDEVPSGAKGVVGAMSKGSTADKPKGRPFPFGKGKK
jgi:hypothetical protein